MGRLEQIWIKRARRGPMDPRPSATLLAERGLVGNANQGGFRQVTIISRERWHEVVSQLPEAVGPEARRANLLVSGINLEQSSERILRVGPCRLRIRGETRPCEQMDEACPGLRDLLRPHWGGGAFAQVLDDGEIAVGDEVTWLLARAG
jgi:MOSC domain-containing protein YiiM